MLRLTATLALFLSAAPLLAGSIRSSGFVPNKGQTDPAVKFYQRGPDHFLYFSTSEASVRSTETRSPLALRFLGARRDVRIEGHGIRPGRIHELVGNDPSRWRTNLASYDEVRYRDLWPGIDLSFREAAGRVKYELRLSPGAKISDIRFAYRGAKDLRVDQDGNLIVTTGDRAVVDERPLSYQIIDGRRVDIPTRFVVRGKSFGFSLDRYDARYPLVIDPALVYSTFLGGNDFEFTPNAAADALGNLYMAGSAISTNFPTTPGAFDSSHNGGPYDVVVAKFNPTGTDLLYCTYLGGSGSEFGEGMTIDSTGNVYITGRTTSTNFPTTADTFRPTYVGGETDLFVAKLNAAGSALLWATYLGGTDADLGLAVGLDISGNVYVTGTTLSADFPTTAGAFDPTFNGGYQDAFVTKLNPSASALVYSTYLGGATDLDVGEDVVVDSSGNAYVAGYTDATDFPTTPGAFDPTFNGGFFTGQDLFVSKLDSAGVNLVYSTYLGGNGREFFCKIALGISGDLFVTTRTSSSNFPTTPGAFDTTFDGDNTILPEIFDAAVTQLDPTGSSLLYSTYLGGSGSDLGNDVAVDAAGNAYVAGHTNSADFPVTCGALDPSLGGGIDAFIVRLDAAGSRLLYSTYFGGTDNDAALSIALDPSGGVHLAGLTSGPNFPTTPGAFDTSYNGGSWDLFAAKFDASFLSPQGALTELAERVAELNESGALNDGQANSLTKKLDAAIDQLNSGNTAAAANQLNAFSNQVNAFQNAGILSPSEAQALTEAADCTAAEVGG